MLDELTIKFILASHDKYWEDRRNEMYQYRAAYEHDFWEKNIGNGIGDDLRVETSEAYGIIESFVASLYSKTPGVVIKQDIRGKGAPEKAQVLANDWLSMQRSDIKLASIRSLLYGASFIKLLPREDLDIFKRVIPVAINPWEIIIDRDAYRWTEQKYTGHVYWLSLKEAKKKFGNKKYDTLVREDYFDKNMGQDKYPNNEMFKFIRVVELYDIDEKTVKFWSPNYANGERILDEGPMLADAIGRPIIPIVPLYFISKVDRPLEGYSSLKIRYDQIKEMNILRTYQARAVRKSARQWLLPRGVLTDEQKAMIESGYDGLLIEVDADEYPIDKIIAPIPQTPVPQETYEYYQYVKQDLDRGSLVAPFTKGEATKATATEVTALAAYTSTEIGSFAKERDSFVEQLVEVYLGILSYYLDENDQPELVTLKGKSMVINPEDISARFNIFASDTASTPLTDIARKSEFMGIVGPLAEMGVPKDKILEHMVSLFDLPEDFIPEKAEQLMPTQQQPPTQTGEVPPQPPEAPGEPPISPQAIRNVLPSEGGF